MPRQVTRSEIARLKGVSRQAVTNACNRGPLREAGVGRRVDLDHPATRKYLGERHPDATSPPKKKRQATKKPTASSPESAAKKPSQGSKKRATKKAPAAPTEAPAMPDDLPDPPDPLGDIGEVADMSLREVVRRFGTKTAFRDWLVALKGVEDIREKRLRNEETEGRLIERELVRVHLFGAIEAGNRRLLNDSSKTIARRIYSMAKGGASIEEAEQTVREVIGSQLKPVKDQAARKLRNA